MYKRQALGGTASFVDAGAIRTPATEPIPARSLPLMFLSRVFFVGVILLTLWLTVDDRRKRRLATVITASAFLVCGVLSFTRIDQQPFVFDPQSLPITPQGTANYSLRLRTGLADQPETPWVVEEPVRIELYLGSSDPVELRWLADGTEIPIRRYKQSRWVTDSLWDLNKLQETRSWTFQITNPSDQLIRVRGWQRTALPDRRLDSPLPSPVLPGIEVRVRDPGSGALRFAAY